MYRYARTIVIVIGTMLMLALPLTAQMPVIENRTINYVFTTIDFPGAASSDVFGINNVGQLAGTYNDAAGRFHGFVYNRHQGTFATVEPPNATLSSALGINDTGDIVGSSYSNTGEPYGFLYRGGLFTTIVVPGSSFTYAFGINSNRQIVGNYATGAPGCGDFGFVYSDGVFNTINVPGQVNNLANGINTAGQIVGYSYASCGGPFEGYLLDANGIFSTITVAAATGTRAQGINDIGQVVGYSWGPDGVEHGFVNNNGEFTTIDVPGATNTAPLGINNAGEIAGLFSDASGVQHGFIATPALTPFVSFEAQLAIVMSSDASGFLLGSTFTLGEGTNSINPLTEAVTLSVGSYNVTIPQGSFKRIWNGAYLYSGNINETFVEASIAPLSGNKYEFWEAATPTLPATSNPVNVKLTIGNNVGTTSVNATFVGRNRQRGSSK